MSKIVARSRRDVNYNPMDYALVDDSGESFVQQADFDRSDINRIVERYVRTGILESVKQTQGMYGDFSDITDYHDALYQVQLAEENFMTLPATVRERFENDPGKFLDFVTNESNLHEMAEMGLLNEEAQARYSAKVAAEAAAAEPV